ncbi:hypothetical protein PHET_05573, partial [Paragonimus heterotremus]
IGLLRWLSRIAICWISGDQTNLSGKIFKSVSLKILRLNAHSSLPPINRAPGESWQSRQQDRTVILSGGLLNAALIFNKKRNLRTKGLSDDDLRKTVGILYSYP